MPAGWVAAGAAVLNYVSSKNSADAATDAAGMQAESADKSIAEQRRQYDLARADNAPFMETGVAANKRLAYLLGLNPSSNANFSGSSSSQSSVPLNRDQLRAQLLSQYTGKPTPGPGGNSIIDQMWDEAASRMSYGSRQTGFYAPDAANNSTSWYEGRPDTPGTVDEAGLNAAIEQRLAQQSQGQQQFSGEVAGGDFGSLLRRFTMADRDADPVYQSGLEFSRKQGADAIDARALANGSYDSGATLKALTRYGSDFGTTRAEGAYNRYNTDNTNIYNRLAGVSGAGQTATNTVTSAGANAANNISNDLTGAGNARAAGIVGGANAWGGMSSGISGLANNYQSNQTLQALLNRNGGGGSNGYTYSGGIDYSTPQPADSTSSGVIF
jgi:hypothetical protein